MKKHLVVLSTVAIFVMLFSGCGRKSFSEKQAELASFMADSIKDLVETYDQNLKGGRYGQLENLLESLIIEDGSKKLFANPVFADSLISIANSYNGSDDMFHKKVRIWIATSLAIGYELNIEGPTLTVGEENTEADSVTCEEFKRTANEIIFKYFEEEFIMSDIPFELAEHFTDWIIYRRVYASKKLGKKVVDYWDARLAELE